MLGRNAARCGSLGRAVGAQAPAAGFGAARFGASGYDWNMGVPGSRIKNPAPEAYNDLYPGMGKGWWALIGISTATFFWGSLYDTSRGVNIAIGLFGCNMPM